MFMGKFVKKQVFRKIETNCLDKNQAYLNTFKAC